MAVRNSVSRWILRIWYRVMLLFPTYLLPLLLLLSGVFDCVSLVVGGSSFPGLPLPIDSMLICCKWRTLIPREKIIFLTHNHVYQYDPIAQETIQLYRVIELFLNPVGAGIVLNPGQGLPSINASMALPTDGADYFFAGDKYWQWKDRSVGTLSVLGSIARDWMPGIDNMDGWLPYSEEYSYIFVGENIYRYMNIAGHADTNVSWPQSISSVLGPTFPLHVDDADLHPERQDWLIFHGDQHTLYSPVLGAALPGYPRAVHNDIVDGGVNGMDRVRCSGVTELSSMIGFVEDKSPTPELRATPYDQQLACEWLIIMPSPMLKSPTTYNGFEFYFDRFDLGSGAQVEIYELQDRPNNIIDSGWHYQGPSTDRLMDQVWIDQGSFDSIQPNRSNPEVLLGVYTAMNPPNLTATQPIGRSSAASMTLRVRFTTTTDVGPAGTGFSLRWMAARPTLARYTALDSIFWLSELGQTGKTNDKYSHAIIIDPDTITPSTVDVTLRISLYPMRTEYLSLLRVVVRGHRGTAFRPCDELSMFQRGLTSNECQFTVSSLDVPFTLEYSSGPGFTSVVEGSYRAETTCHGLTVFNASAGSFNDGSGPHAFIRPKQNCQFLIQPTTNGTNDHALTQCVLVDMTKFDIGNSDVRVYVYDGDSIEAPLVRTMDQTTGTISAPILSSGASLLVSLRSEEYVLNANEVEGVFTTFQPPRTDQLVHTPISLHVTEQISTYLRLLSSPAEGLLYFDEIQDIMIASVDSALYVDAWFQVFHRSIPDTLRQTNPTAFEAIMNYPNTITDTTPDFWSSHGITLGISDLRSVFEATATPDGRIRFAAPDQPKDYWLVTIFAIHVKCNQPVEEGWMQSPYDPFSYSFIGGKQLAHLAPSDTGPTELLAVRLTPEDSRQITYYDSSSVSVWTLQQSCLSILRGASSNGVGSGLNAPIVAGETVEVLLTTMTMNWTVLVADNIRAFFSSPTARSATPAENIQLTTGIQLMRMYPTIAATDYEFIILLSDGLIYHSGGPFRPTVLPSSADPLQSSIVWEATGQSLLTGTVVLRGRDLELLVTVRDRFGNMRTSGSDEITLEWSGHRVRPVPRNSSSSLAEYRFLVDADGEYEQSKIRCMINGSPIGFDPTQELTGALDSEGIQVTVGERTVVYYDVPVGTYAVITTLTYICMVLAICLMIFTHIHRETKILRVSSPNFLLLMLFGSLIEYSCIPVLLSPATTDLICGMQTGLGHLGFWIVFGALFVKTGRVKSIVFEKKFRKASSDAALFLRLAILFLGYVLYYIIWQVVSPPRPIAIVQDFISYAVCTTEQTVFPTLMLGLEVAFVLYGAYVSATIWNVSLLNEVKFLLIGIYNVAVVGGLFAILIKVVITTPSTQQLFLASGILFVTTGILSAIFLPKLIMICRCTAKPVSPPAVVPALEPAIQPAPHDHVPDGSPAQDIHTSPPGMVDVVRDVMEAESAAQLAHTLSALYPECATVVEEKVKRLCAEAAASRNAVSKGETHQQQQSRSVVAASPTGGGVDVHKPALAPISESDTDSACFMHLSLHKDVDDRSQPVAATTVHMSSNRGQVHVSRVQLSNWQVLVVAGDGHLPLIPLPDTVAETSTTHVSTSNGSDSSSFNINHRRIGDVRVHLQPTVDTPTTASAVAATFITHVNISELSVDTSSSHSSLDQYIMNPAYLNSGDWPHPPHPSKATDERKTQQHL